MKQEKKRKTSIIVVVICLLVLAVLIVWGYWQKTKSNNNDVLKESISSPQNRQLTITRVIDGDTIMANEERIRLIGVDAEEMATEENQETSCRAQAAKNYLDDLLLNQTVTIEIGQDPEDDYGRTLAYIFLDEELVNAKMISEGLGDVWLMAPNIEYSRELIDAQIIGEEKQTRIDFCQNLN
jgi:micrococcal nuclease